MKLKGFLVTILIAFSLVGFFAGATTRVEAVLENHEIEGAGGGVDGSQEFIRAVQLGEENLNSETYSINMVENFLQSALIYGLGEPELRGGNGVAGAIPSMGKAIGMIYQSAPASGQLYVADLLHNANIGLAQPAYAQTGVGGLGFSSLEPILEAWKQFRNLAYLFFIIVTLIVGFMIMLRQKVGGQAAVTAQQAIPNIVIALIAVTFSYAIAGFLIDMMYVMMYLMVGLFSDVATLDDVSSNILELGQRIITVDTLKTAYGSVNEFTAASLAEIKIEEIIGAVAGVIFAVIIAFAYLFALVGLFFELLKTYVSIIISILLSPLLLMMGALPGRGDVFSGWVKSLVGNLIAFPTVLLLLIIHKLLTAAPALEGGFLPPYLTGRGSGGAVSVLVGLAIMLIAKDLVKEAKKSINPKGGGIFEQFGSAVSASLKQGYEGGQLIPGVGLSDTTRLPVVGKYLGSAKGMMRTAPVAASAVGGTLFGAAELGVDVARRVKAGPRGADLTFQGLKRGPQVFRAVDRRIGPGKKNEPKK